MVYGTSKDLMCKKEKINRNNIIKQYKNFQLNQIAKEDIKEHSSKWTEIPNHRYRILIIGGSTSEKANTLANLINYQPDIDKIY